MLHDYKTSLKNKNKKYLVKINYTPWLMWLTGLNAGLTMEKLQVQIPVRARAWIAGGVPNWGHK